jgi:hypothetical protein
MWIEDAITRQKKMLFEKDDNINNVGEASPHFLHLVWELFMIGMILYFVVSFLNAIVRNYLGQQSLDQKRRRTESSSGSGSPGYEQEMKIL